MRSREHKSVPRVEFNDVRKTPDANEKIGTIDRIFRSISSLAFSGTTGDAHDVGAAA
jgi:hypothetical protein